MKRKEKEETQKEGGEIVWVLNSYTHNEQLLL